MRIYTNFDSWKIMAHKIPLGWISYKGKEYNLDEKNNQIEILNKLINDELINFWEKDEKNLSFKNLNKFYFKFLTKELEKFNFKLDGTPNRMQYFTVLLNLKRGCKLIY